VPPHDPTRPTVEGSARPDAVVRLASTPSLATTAPMQNLRTDHDGQRLVPLIAKADNPENDAAGELPPAQDEDRQVESWLGDLRPPHTSDPWPAQSTNGDDPNASPAIPARRQQDPDAT
jgi:hypothetical protein